MARRGRRYCSGNRGSECGRGGGEEEEGGEGGRPVLTISAYGVHGPERALMAAVDACLVIRCLPNPVLLI